jgi:hypothetical protein
VGAPDIRPGKRILTEWAGVPDSVGAGSPELVACGCLLRRPDANDRFRRGLRRNFQGRFASGAQWSDRLFSREAPLYMV